METKYGLNHEDKISRWFNYKKKRMIKFFMISFMIICHYFILM